MKKEGINDDEIKHHMSFDKKAAITESRFKQHADNLNLGQIIFEGS